MVVAAASFPSLHIVHGKVYAFKIKYNNTLYQGEVVEMLLLFHVSLLKELDGSRVC